jgi:REP element-mobilizing transposase RayT
MRLAGFDYSRFGAYFVTICLQDQHTLLSDVVDGCVQLTSAGQIVERCWNEIPRHYPYVALDAYVVMPNHMHGVLALTEPAGAGLMEPVAAGLTEPVAAGHARPLQPLSAIVGSFKSAVTKQIGKPIWQRSYWDRIIRSDAELHTIRAYIEDNPSRWPVDP